MTETTLTLYRISWDPPKDAAGRELPGAPRVLRIMERECTLRPRRSAWDCLPLDTYEDLDHAAREMFFASPEEALDATLDYYQNERDHVEKRIAQVRAEVERRAKPAKPARRTKGRAT